MKYMEGFGHIEPDMETKLPQPGALSSMAFRPAGSKASTLPGFCLRSLLPLSLSNVLGYSLTIIVELLLSLVVDLMLNRTAFGLVEKSPDV